jgi:hypothetical protein
MSSSDHEKRPVEEEEKAIGGGLPSGEEEVVTSEVPPSLRASVSRPDTFLGRLRRYEAALDRRLGVEAHGIARKLPDDRDPAFARWHNQAVMFLLWMSSTLNLSCFATGFLGWQFQLDLRRNIVIIIFATLLGSAVTVSPPLSALLSRSSC